jgi:tetratricopeptide (TPR) repeat protein
MSRPSKERDLTKADVATGGDASAAEPVGKPAACNWEVLGFCAALAILVFIVYGQTLYFDFVNYDDNGYVYENPEVTMGLTPGGVVQAFTHEESGLWNPLVTISHMLDWRLYGSNAGGHHLTNVVLHLCSVILLFLIMLDMTGALWQSAFVAAVFAIHPLRVESVAWISERKDMLSGLFFMLTLGAYLRYVRRPGAAGRYWAVILLFVLGLMCKLMLVTLPFILLLLDYWPLKRLFLMPPTGGGVTKAVSVNWRAIVEKMPLLAISLGVCLTTIVGPKDTSVVDIDLIPFWTRMCEAPVWLVTYLGQMIWPTGLAVVYTHFEESLTWWPAALALSVSMTLGIYLLRGKYPWLWMGWLWNLGMLLPVIGIVQISRHARADHYNYLPQIGLYVGLTWVAADWAGRRRDRRMILGGAALVILSTLLLAAWDQTTYWRDSETLWTHALECTRDNFIARDNLGLVPLEQGRMDAAVAQFREALRINPAYGEAHYNLGNALRQQGHTDEAIAQYRDAVRTAPDLAAARYNLGIVLLQQGRTDEAIAQFREALRINPSYAEVHGNLGAALFQEGRTDEAIAEFREALRINPADANAHNNLGSALLQQGYAEEAMTQYRDALRLNPALAGAHNNLGSALLQEGRTNEAVAAFGEALRLNPSYAKAHNNLGNALLRQGHAEEAIAQYRAAVQISPAYVDAQNNLGNTLLQQGRTGEAIAAIEKALELQPANVLLQNNLAWMLSTATHPSLRDGARAMQLATQASRSGGGNDPMILRTLAAAYAQAGQFPNAVQTAQKARDLAQAQSNTSLAGALLREINLYETGQPFREGK